MTNSTKAAQTIISNIQRNVGTNKYGQLIMNAVLNAAQNFVNKDGYVWDVALAMACKEFRCTENCAFYIYE
tara:strand:- start:23314 stop:23526 length:213 start_codon:yes stop_codon:yes gene_type:complete